MPFLIDIDETKVNLGDNFNASQGTIYKETNEIPEELQFTRTITSDLIFQETERGRLLTSLSDISLRTSLPPGNPITGPFIPNYSYLGSLDNSDFINLLLVNKPPIRTGFFEFSVKGIKFVGFITKLTEYIHWNWELYFGKYEYVQQLNPLGYGIEISNNLLYTASYSAAENRYIYTPTAIYNTLISLRGDEEITSTATNIDPNTYLNPVSGDIVPSGNSLPIDLFYISPADALRYIASYEDLIEEFGADVLKGQQHYAQFARRINFNPVAYLNSHADLRQRFGFDTFAATQHYIQTGYYEGREWESGSGFIKFTGGLYDERYGDFGLTEQSLVWPNGATLGNSNRTLTYKFNRTDYYLNGETPVNSNTIFMRRQ